MPGHGIEITNQTQNHTAMQDFQFSLLISAPIHEVFNALTIGIHQWWTEDVEGSANKKGDEFKIRFGSTFKTMSVSDIIPDQLVVWTCIQAHINNPKLKDKSEWVGTNIVWDLKEERHQTRLLITHFGLTEEFECYDICKQGWVFYIRESLLPWLTTGKGKPDKKRLVVQ